MFTTKVSFYSANLISTSKFNTCIFNSSRYFTTTSGKKLIIGRYNTLPISLYRICNTSRKIVLRDYNVQKAKGLASYDLILNKDGIVEPSPLTNEFLGPNGASLRPAGTNMFDIVSNRKGVTNILEIPKDTVLPEGLVLLHEHGDHYSLQCSKPMKLKELHSLMNNFLKDFPFYGKAEYFAKHPYPLEEQRIL